MRLYCGCCDVSFDDTPAAPGSRHSTFTCPKCGYRGACEIRDLQELAGNRPMHHKNRMCGRCKSPDQLWIDDTHDRVTCYDCGLSAPMQ